MEKKNVFVVGCNGKMGRIVCDLIRNSEDFIVTHGFDMNTDSKSDIIVHTSSPTILPYPVDVIIDFSKPEATMAILPLAVNCKIPMVIATTGFSSNQLQSIRHASLEIPIFQSNNMAYSTKSFIELVKYSVKLFQKPYEISIHEIHHSEKKDAPSGTATMLFNAINESCGNTLTSRFDSNGLKGENEVWISSERVGHFRGEHTVTIAGPSDFVQLKHFVNDRGVFAEGALEAARYIMKQTEPGIYTMDNLFNE